MKGVVAAGHPLTAQAGAEVLRKGGNAVDAAAACVLLWFVAESRLTGPGAGGFMLLHTAEREDHLLDFFVAAPGLGLESPKPAELVPIDVTFAEGAVQRFNAGPSSCGVWGTTRGIAEALDRFGSVALPELGGLLERLGAEGPDFLYTGDVGRKASDLVLERGGLVTREDLAAYDVVERTPAQVTYHGRDVLTNPPPSSGGILIADALGILERVERPGDLQTLAEVIASTNRARDQEFLEGLGTEGYLEQFLAASALDEVAGDVHGRLGSTTHISVMDADGACATVTCSNGSCSGVVVPGTGLHLNNMLGEEDLNPAGYHLHEPATRVPSMMAPTVVLRDGLPELALGSAGSNRIRSAILQTTLAVVDKGLPAEEAVRRPRIHVEDDVVEAEPGIDPQALDRLEARDWKVRRWKEQNLFFGGVQAVARQPDTGALSGGGDPRRGGVATVVE